MKQIFFPVLLALLSLNAYSVSAAKVKTSIDVTAEISTSVRIYVNGNDVTNSVISLALEDKNGYMTGLTPEFQFIGNASRVSLSLTSPTTGGLVSESGDVMGINTLWVKDGKDSYTSFGISLPVYATIQEAPTDSGVKVRFTSAARSETYPLGAYSGTYEVTVTPST